jgi:hypothetical protein
LEFEESINFNIQIFRCDEAGSTLKCKDKDEISDFIDHLIVGQAEQEKKIQIDNHDASPPLIDHLKFKEVQLESKSVFRNYMYLNLNRFELNDNPMTFL